LLNRTFSCKAALDGQDASAHANLEQLQDGHWFDNTAEDGVDAEPAAEGKPTESRGGVSAGAFGSADALVLKQNVAKMSCLAAEGSCQDASNDGWQLVHELKNGGRSSREQEQEGPPVSEL